LKIPKLKYWEFPGIHLKNIYRFKHVYSFYIKIIFNCQIFSNATHSFSRHNRYWNLEFYWKWSSKNTVYRDYFRNRCFPYKTHLYPNLWTPLTPGQFKSINQTIPILFMYQFVAITNQFTKKIFKCFHNPNRKSPKNQWKATALRFLYVYYYLIQR
jgi:hypothetical protein